MLESLCQKVNKLVLRCKGLLLEDFGVIERSFDNSEYDQEIPQSQTTDNPMAPQGRAAQPSRDTRKTNFAKQLSHDYS